MNFSPDHLIFIMNSLPPEVIWLLMLGVCFSTVLILNRLFGSAGLYVYIAVAVIGANIQVLKAVQFSLYDNPVALGTILFSSTFLATDLLAEQFGAQAARQGVWLGFVAYLFFTLVMLLTLGFSPLTPEQAGDSMSWAVPYQDHLTALFAPQPALFAAGMLAYLFSQLHDVWLFDKLKTLFSGRKLWLRNNVSTLLSALIDNTVFSILAWMVFTATPLPFDTVFWTYILGTYWLRLFVAVFDTPFIYLARRWHKIENAHGKSLQDYQNRIHKTIDNY
jgi:hypothetical protein